MIKDFDRSRYIGASDTGYVMGNWNTKTFAKWWLEKLGLLQNGFQNRYTLAGSMYEHKILDSLGILGLEKDKQIMVPELKLRVNLDGNTDSTIYEVKTYKESNGFLLSKGYFMQVQVQMYASGIRKAFLVSYPLTDRHYSNFFLEVDSAKIDKVPIVYDETFISQYLKRLRYLSECLEKGAFPIDNNCTD